MSTVFVVQHAHPSPSGDDETKFIGVYATRGDALLAVRRLRKQPGFKETPRDFYIEAYKLNDTSWAGGFVRMIRGHQASIRRAKTRKIKT
jgi:hypothetical protein